MEPNCPYHLNMVVMEITNRCNLHCPHCASASGHARPDEMSCEEIKGVVHDLAALGCGNVTILGGEALLRPDWFEIAQEIRASGMELTLITNGLLVTPETRAKLKTLDPRVVCVSIDGATPETYRAARGVDGFNRCLQLLKDLVADGFRQVNAITTFSSKNIDDFDRFAELFIDTDIVWQVQVVHKAGERFDDSLLLTRDRWITYAKKLTDCLYRYNGRLKIVPMDDFGYFPLTPKLRFIEQKCWDGCPAGRYVLGIRANGDVLACLSLGSDFVEANLRTRPLADIWNDERMFARFRHKCTELTGRCAHCVKARECRAGCSAAALSTTGTLTENHFCVRQFETEQMLTEMIDD